MCGHVPNSLDEVFLLISFNFGKIDQILKGHIASAKCTTDLQITEKANNLRKKKITKKKYLDLPILNNPPSFDPTPSNSELMSPSLLAILVKGG